VLRELTDGSHVGLARALGESGELEILEELLAKNVPGGVLSERGVSERASADARRRPSKRESDYEKRKMLTERVQCGVRRAACGVRRSVRVCRGAASLDKGLQLTNASGRPSGPPGGARSSNLVR